eukprot:4444832-Pleurochrysis_carterae.AAC.1
MQGLATGFAMASQGAMQVPSVQPFSYIIQRAHTVCNAKVWQITVQLYPPALKTGWSRTLEV